MGGRCNVVPRFQRSTGRGLTGSWEDVEMNDDEALAIKSHWNEFVDSGTTEEGVIRVAGINGIEIHKASFTMICQGSRIRFKGFAFCCTGPNTLICTKHTNKHILQFDLI